MPVKRPPIPRALLPHQAQLHEVTADAWQHPVSAGQRELKFIRIEEDLLRQADERDAVHAARWLLFYDCRNSLPRGVTFAPEQGVSWNDLRLTVMQVTPVWEDRALHHYEIMLEGG